MILGCSTNYDPKGFTPMAQFQSAVSDLLACVQHGEEVDVVRESVRIVLQELIDAEAIAVIGADRYERSPERIAERNGVRSREVMTKGGTVEVKIPKLRSGSFFPSVLERRRRIDQALYAVVMEAWVNGVSTRAVDNLVQALGGTGISKSEVSRICQGLDDEVGRFRTRRLDACDYPYVFLDATYLHVRADHVVTSKAVVVATAVTADGRREILGLDVGDSEDEVFWRGFLTSLKKRGLHGVKLVISDQHAGLVAAIARCFQGAGHQRCRVHYARNLLALVPRSQMDMVAALFRTIFAQPDPDTMSATWDTVRDQLAGRIPKIGPHMDTAKSEVLAFNTFPRAHWRKIWSTNPLERLNKEIKRRARVVGIFPNEASVIRLVGMILTDTNDEWITDERRYLSENSMALLYPDRNNGPVPALPGGTV